ncbi:MAG: glycosyltransferase, partial [Actinomycetota bacterium]
MPIASVVVPAHQERDAIGACLESLLGDALPGEFEVAVAANGCTDGTADVARVTAARLGHEVVVLELPEAGKAAAVRAAERHLSTLPRVFVDADVECPTGTVRSLVDALASGADVAVPRRVLDLSGASRPARLYYRFWSDLPWVQSQLTGRGVYAVGPAARATYEQLPDLVAEDRFVTTRVPRDRAAIVDAAVVVRPPARLPDVVRVRRRV